MGRWGVYVHRPDGFVEDWGVSETEAEARKRMRQGVRRWLQTGGLAASVLGHGKGAYVLSLHDGTEHGLLYVREVSGD